MEPFNAPFMLFVGKAAVPSFPRLYVIDPGGGFRGLPGEVISAQIDRFEELFQIDGESVPRTSVITPL